MEDRELIQRILNGSIEDYRFLIERYQLRLQSTLSYYCMDKVEIEYYLHEAFVKTYSKLDKFDLDAPFFPWLKTIALNMIRDDMRKKKTLSDDIKEFLISQFKSENQSDQKILALKSCIAKLDDKQQQLLKLRYWEGVSIEDISEQAKRGESAVKMQLLRLRNVLKSCIKQELSHG